MFLGDSGSTVSKQTVIPMLMMDVEAQMCLLPIFDTDKVTNINYVSVTNNNQQNFINMTLSPTSLSPKIPRSILSLIIEAKSEKNGSVFEKRICYFNFRVGGYISFT